MAPRDPNEIDEEDLSEEGSDAGQIDDEGGDDAQTGQEPQELEAQEGLDRRARRQDQIREELRAEREHRARVEQELQQLRAEREQRQQPQEESDDQFQARVALMDPEQRIDAKLERAIKQQQKHFAATTFQNADRADRSAFESKAAFDPIYKKYAQEVENVLALERRKGRDFDRETVLDFVRGRALRMKQGQTNQARQQGQRNVQRQQATTTGGRSDQGRQQTRRFASNDMSPEAVRARLEADGAFI